MSNPAIDSKSVTTSRFFERGDRVLMGVVIAMLLYYGVLPLQFRSDWPPADRATLLGLLVAPTGWPDVLTNIILYMPLGMLLQWRHRGSRLVLRTGRKLALVLGTTLAVEFSQQFVQYRQASWPDVVCNVFGAGLGAAMMPALRSVFNRAHASILRNLVRNPYTLLWQGVATSLILMTVQPTTVVPGVRQMVKAVMRADYRPLGQLHASEAALAGSGVSGVAVRQMRMDFAADVFAQGVAYAAFAIVGVIALLREFDFNRRSSVGLAMWCCVLVALVCGMLHIVAVGQVQDVAFVVVALATSTVAIVTASMRRWDRCPPRVALSDCRLWMGLLAVHVGYIAVRSLIPFEFAWPGLRGAVNRFAWMPMQDFFTSNLPVVATHLLSLGLRYMLFGMLIAAIFQNRLTGNLQRVTIRAAAWAFGLAFGLELAQVALTVRTPGISSALFASAAAAAGVVVVHWLCYLRRLTMGQAQSIAPASEPETVFGPATAEQLAASMADIVQAIADTEMAKISGDHEHAQSDRDGAPAEVETEGAGRL